jgi:D-alanyl-D-alanine dipeptidase
VNRGEFLTGVASVALTALLGAWPSAAEPPREHGKFRKPDLVELITLDPGLRLDIRYATVHNFLGVPLYKQARAFLQRPAAEAVVRADRALRKQGYGLTIFDGYRPWRVTKFMWDHSRPAWRSGGYVADPSQGSRHNRGCAVDLTLYDRKTGKAVEMPTPYDSFKEQAHAFSPHVSKAARAHRAILQKVMLAEGFLILPEEWWHFDYKDYRHYGILDVDFGAIPTVPVRGATGHFNKNVTPATSR